jgi:hypothetical protein
MAPKLAEPLWQRQAGETEAEFDAFGAWVDFRDWHRVGAIAGLSQPEALELATRWAWHARTRAWDAEQASEADSERKAHQKVAQVARNALPELLRVDAAIVQELGELVHEELAAHHALARASAKGEPGAALPTLSWGDVLRGARVVQQGVRDLERIARPVTPETAGEAREPGWDFSRASSEQLKAIQAARAAARGG